MAIPALTLRCSNLDTPGPIGVGAVECTALTLGNETNCTALTLDVATGGTILANVDTTNVLSLAMGAGDFISLGATPALSGQVRIPPGVTAGLCARDNAGTADISLISLAGSPGADVIFFGGAGPGTTSFVFGFSTISWQNILATPTLQVSAKTTDVAPQNMFLGGQSAWTGAAVNTNGGFTYVEGGNSTSNGVTGLRGGVRLTLSRIAAQVALEVTEVAVGQRALVLGQWGSGIGAGALPAGGGDGVIILGTTPTAPSTGVPGAGFGMLWQTTTGLHYQGHGSSFMDYEFAPTVEGTSNTQAGQVQSFSGFARTTAASAVTILTLPLPTATTSGVVNLTVVGRDVTAGTVGDIIAFQQIAAFTNVAGTVTGAATQGTQEKATAASMATCTLTYSVSATNILVQVTGLGAVTIDWTATAQWIVN